MNLKESLEKRFSVRSYKKQEVEKEKLEYILECARLSPSAANKQAWTFIVAQSEEAKKKIHEVYVRDWFADADCYIVVCGQHNQAWKRPLDGKDSTDIDASIAATAILLAVEDIGLSTCWVGNFDEKKLKESFKLSDDTEAIAIFPIAYAEEDIKTPQKKRKKIEEISLWI